jgi:hypothetical protein
MRPPAGKCRACGCTQKRGCPGGCLWSDQTRTHCTACFCPLCGRKWLSSSNYTRDSNGVRICRSRRICEEALLAIAAGAPMPLDPRVARKVEAALLLRKKAGGQKHER